MKLGIVSDIHCNAAGLEHALGLMGEIDELICLGDSINEYRFSNEVVPLLKERAAAVILGNHEEVFFGPLGARARARDGTDPDLADWLAHQPHRRELTVGGKRLLLVHSTRGSRAAPMFTREQPARALRRGGGRYRALRPHPRQVVRQIGKMLVINPGSTGEARDHRNGGQLSCAVLDTASEEVQLFDFPDPRAA